MKRRTVSARWHSAGLCAPGNVASSRVEPDGIDIACYQNHVPPFIETELERLYQNIFSSMLQSVELVVLLGGARDGQQEWGCSVSSEEPAHV